MTNAYWVPGPVPGTARIATARFANQARRALEEAELVVFPSVTVAVMGLERCVEAYVHEYLCEDVGHFLQLA